MGLVRERSFQLKEITALSIRQSFNHSQNKPFLINGVDKNTGNSNYYVLKPTKASRMYTGAAMRELIAALIAIEIEIPVPEPVIIDITSNFVELSLNKEYYNVLQASIGKNFGSLYLEGFTTWTDAHYKNNLLLSSMQSTFVFDVLIENTDRNSNKPNMLVGKDQIYLIDHEIAFSFADLILFTNPKPWILSENECDLARQHLFYGFLRGKSFYSVKLIEKMTNLDSKFWEAVEDYLPTSWKHEKYDIIKDHLLKRIYDLEEFQNGIKRLLT